MRIIDLTLATDRYEHVQPQLQPGTQLDDETGEVVDMDGEPVRAAPIDEVEVTHPVRVDADWVAYYHPRQKSRGGRERVGTRIVFKNGHAMAVREGYDEVRNAIASAQ